MEKGIEKTLSGVDRTVAADMVKRYADKHKGEQGIIKSVWFNLDQLDKVITLLKAERIMSGEAQRRYGIRFYMGTYGANSMHVNMNGISRPYTDKDTVLMVSTMQGEEDGEVKYNVDYFTDYFKGLDVTPIENHGELCPEDCAGTAPDFL